MNLLAANADAEGTLARRRGVWMLVVKEGSVAGDRAERLEGVDAYQAAVALEARCRRKFALVRDVEQAGDMHLLPWDPANAETVLDPHRGPACVAPGKAEITTSRQVHERADADNIDERLAWLEPHRVCSVMGIAIDANVFVLDWLTEEVSAHHAVGVHSLLGHEGGGAAGFLDQVDQTGRDPTAVLLGLGEPGKDVLSDQYGIDSRDHRRSRHFGGGIDGSGWH